MKKLSVTFFLLLSFIISNSVFAQDLQLKDNTDGAKICLAGEIMKEIVKQTIYTVGAKVLDKYAGTGYNPYPTYNPGYNNIPQNTTTNTTTNTNTTPNEGPQEQLIPLS